MSKIDYQLQRQQSLTSLQVFLDKDYPELPKLIEFCNLYPVDTSWNSWTDNQEYIINISLLKRIIKIKRSYPKQIIITDLYQKIYPLNLLPIAEKVLIAYAGNIKFIWFFCLDKRLRMAVSIDNIWQPNPLILSCGWRSLSSIIKYFLYLNLAKWVC